MQLQHQSPHLEMCCFILLVKPCTLQLAGYTPHPYTSTYTLFLLDCTPLSLGLAFFKYPEKIKACTFEER